MAEDKASDPMQIEGEDTKAGGDFAREGDDEGDGALPADRAMLEDGAAKLQDKTRKRGRDEEVDPSEEPDLKRVRR